MAYRAARKAHSLVITTSADGLDVQSMTLNGEPLPLEDILGYTITHGPHDVPEVTVRFLAVPSIRVVAQPDEDRLALGGRSR